MKRDLDDYNLTQETAAGKNKIFASLKNLILMRVEKYECEHVQL